MGPETPRRSTLRPARGRRLAWRRAHADLPRRLPRSSANGMQQKLYNWNTLNQKVFKRMGFQLSKQECEAIANCKPGAVERVLKLVQNQIMLHQGRSEEEAFPISK
jgi:hypothetical protein